MTERGLDPQHPASPFEGSDDRRPWDGRVCSPRTALARRATLPRGRDPRSGAPPDALPVPRGGEIGAAPPLPAAVHPPEALVGRSSGLIEVIQAVDRLASRREPVLLVGEGGTGKALVAKALHRRAPWAAGPFVHVHAGAVEVAPLAAARGGTLFVDALEDGSDRLRESLEAAFAEPRRAACGEADRAPRLSGNEVADVAGGAAARARLVCATALPGGALLVARLGMTVVAMPPLRARRADIPLLAEHFLRHFNDRYGVCRELAGSALEALESFDFPGNIRELRHTIERLVVFTGADRIEAGEVYREVGHALSTNVVGASASLAEVGERAEVGVVLATLARAAGHLGRAAAALGVSVRSLQRTLRRLGVVR